MTDDTGQKDRRNLPRNRITPLSISISIIVAGIVIISFLAIPRWIPFIIAHPASTRPIIRATATGTHSTILTTPSISINQPAPSAPFVSYPMFGFNPQHTNYDPDEKRLSASNVSHLVLAWSHAFSGPLQGAPIVSNGNVYIASDKLYALNMTGGSLLWSTPGTDGGGQTSPAVVNGIAYFVPSGGTTLYAFQATTGTPLWTVAAGSSIFASPTIENGKIYIGANDGNLYAFDATTGTHLWTARTNSGTGNFVSSSSPAVANGIVYIGSTDHKLYAFNATTGALLWSFSAGYIIRSSPVVMNGLVYIGSDDGTFYALNATTGTSIWNFPTGSVFGNSAAIANGVIYASSGSNLYALNAKTGTHIWTTSVSAGSYINEAPLVANGVVYAGSTDDKLHAFNAKTGAILWTYTTGDKVNSSPTIANGMVFVSSDDGKLYAFHLPG